MRRVVNKLAGDSSRLRFKVIYTDYDGKQHEKAANIGKEIDKLFYGYHMKYMYRDMDVYGDGYFYRQIGANTDGKEQINTQDIYGINPRLLEPTDDNGVMTGWQYQGSGDTQDLSLEEVIHIPNDPLTGDLFGISTFESVMQVLNLILNSQLNSAIILDNYALPIVHWQIDAKHERRKTPLSEILKFIDNLKKMSVGNDLVTDSSIKHDIIGAKNKMVDFSPMLDKLDAYFFATAGVPGQILGMPADNMSAITRQLQSYYENVFDKQSTAADYLIEQLYWPEILEAGIDDVYSIDYIHAKPLVEQESRIATWVEKMLQADIIDRVEGRSAIGYQGPPPAESNNYRITQGSASPELDKSNNNPEPKGVNKK
jgi:phage portal protein BeeE